MVRYNPIERIHFAAYDLQTLTELWNSGSSLGDLSKFAAPLIYNGKVFVATQSGYVAIFGINPSSQVRGSTVLRGRGVIR